MDVSAWYEFELAKDILDGLRLVGFTSPTPIQLKCLAPAILHHRDILGAAETVLCLHFMKKHRF